MTDQPIGFGSADYAAWMAILLVARGADLLSTWIATPNLILEGNPIARRLGWRFGLALNLLACAICALLPVAAVMVATSSILVAARNFQSAWVMRSMGETAYQQWHIARLRESPGALYAACLLAQCTLIATLGIALVAGSPINSLPFALGLGIVVYAIAILVFSGLAAVRIRRE